MTVNVRELFQALHPFLGTWRGEGDGDFPGIDPFHYVEEVTFRTRDGEVSIFYEQQTWVIHASGEREASHWESGFLQVTDDGDIDLLNAQTSGRVEVLRGAATLDDAGRLCVDLKSIVHAHDPRMVSTRRQYTIDGDTLRYEADMRTEKSGETLRHLEATLQRSGSVS